MSVRDDGTGLEWAGALGAARPLPDPAQPAPARRYLRMLTEIPRFHRRARALLAGRPDGAGRRPDAARVPARRAASRRTSRRHFMEPLVAAVWSCDPEVALDYPARYLFTFLEHHGMLGVFGSPQWRTVTGGSRSTSRGVAAGLDDVRTGTKVTSVLETADGVEVTDGNGAVDDVRRGRGRHPPRPGAGHARRADRRPSARCSARCRTRANTALLHTDTSLLPRAARRPGVVELPAPAPRPRGAGHGHLRPDPAAAARHRHPLPRHARRRGPRRPGDRDRPDGVRAPALQPRLGRRPAPAARDRHRPDRLRRRLPRLGLPRGRRALRRSAAAERLGLRVASRAAAGAGRRGPRPASTRPRSGTPAARRSGAPSSTARTPGWSTSTTCPTTALARRGSRPATTSATRRARSAPTSRPSSPATAST